MNILAIDPGKTGALVFMGPNGRIITAEAMPLVGKVIDLRTLSTMLKSIEPKNWHVFIEDVHAIHGSAAGATFAFGFACCAPQMGVVTLGIPFTLVQPKAWQKVMYQGIPEMRKPSYKITKGKFKGQMRKGNLDTKPMSLLAAKRLFPDADLRKSDKCTKAHKGIVDALLIAEYGRRKLR